MNTRIPAGLFDLAGDVQASLEITALTVQDDEGAIDAFGYIGKGCLITIADLTLYDDEPALGSVALAVRGIERDFSGEGRRRRKGRRNGSP
jgi:hypothetical protein